MNILFDIGHPGHVYLFKGLIKQLIDGGNRVIITTKNVSEIKYLLDVFELKYIIIGKKKDSLIGKALYQLYYNFNIWKIVRKNNITLGIGTSINIAQVSRFTSLASIVFDDDDDEVQPLFVKYAHSYCNYLLSPDPLRNKRKRKDTIYYPSLHEIAYLHPDIFKPNNQFLEQLGINENDKYFVLRFNSFKAHHDRGERGFSLDHKTKLVELLKPYGKIFITAERNIEPELKQYQFHGPPEYMHTLLYYATLFIGDSQTMTSEAAVLGTPALRFNTLVGRISYLEELEEKYQLAKGFGVTDFNDLILTIKKLLNDENLKNTWKQRRQLLYQEKINPNNFYLWFINNIDRIDKTHFEPGFFKQFI